jgi:hypothetical protein
MYHPFGDLKSKMVYERRRPALVVMAVDSMLRRANRAQAGIQRLHDQALVGAERSRVGIQLGLLALSKPDDDTGKFSG